MKRLLLLLLLLLPLAILLLAGPVSADDPPADAEPAADAPAELSASAVTLDEPLAVYLVLKDKTKVRGQLLAWDRDRLKVKAESGETLVAWDDLPPPAVYATRRRLIDPKDAKAHFDLGVWCWKNNLKRDGIAELTTARRLDPDLADAVEQVKAGTYVAPEQPDDPANGGGDANDAEPGAKVVEGTRTAGETDPDKVVKFTRPTPEQAAAALEETRKYAQGIVEKMNVKLRLVETKHFYILTDWPKGEHDWLEDIFEQMYRGLAKQFGIDPDENIWYGKLAIYAFEDWETFRRFAMQIDGVGVRDGTAGYAKSSSTGHGHIAIWKVGDRRQLSSTIVHEGTHAFLARYRSNMFIPSWLNEGLAQMMEEIGVPDSAELRSAKQRSLGIAQAKVDVRRIFTARSISFDMYPVALTMTDLLWKRSKKKYVAMINDIKDGKPVDKALKDNYGWDYDDLAKYWYKWAEKDFK